VVRKKVPHAAAAVLCESMAYTDASRRCHQSLTRYQRCDLSVILLLEDHSDEHYTAKYPLIDIELRSWIAFSEASDCETCLSIEWQSLENNVSHSRVPSVIMILHHTLWKLGPVNGSSVSIEIMFSSQLQCSDLWYWTGDIRCLDVWSSSDFWVCT